MLLHIALLTASLQARPVAVDVFLTPGEAAPAMHDRHGDVSLACTAWGSGGGKRCTTTVDTPASVQDLAIPESGRVQYRVTRGRVRRVSFHQPIPTILPHLPSGWAIFSAWALVLAGAVWSLRKRGLHFSPPPAIRRSGARYWLLSLLAALAVWLDPAPWRLWLLGTGGVLGLGIAFRDFLWLRERDLLPRDVPYLLAFIVAMQALVIAVTGGIESPIVIILVPISLLPALLLGRRRVFLQFSALPLSV